MTKQLTKILILLIAGAAWADDAHTITAGRHRYTFTPQQGLTAIHLDGKPVVTGSTTSANGSLYTLTRDVDHQDWNHPDNKDTCHFGPEMGSLVGRLGKVIDVQVVSAAQDRYIVRHVYDSGVSLTFDHLVAPPDVTVRVVIDNDTQDFFQLSDWLSLTMEFGGQPRKHRQMDSYYPAANIYSPVVAASSDEVGVGLNWIEHHVRPVEIRLQDRGQTQLVSRVWLKNAPVDPFGRSRYAMVIRVDLTGDAAEPWKHLLTPYKQWFNAYFGPTRYTMDFRIKVASFVSNLATATRENPGGMRHEIADKGWMPYLQARLLPIREHNISHIIFWGVTGASQRGVNYRPEFNVFPLMVDRTLPHLRAYCERVNVGMGFFARPNTIAYRRNFNEDGDVEWNPLDAKHLAMGNERFKDLLDKGATAFYLDTFGSSVGCFPLSSVGMVHSIKQMRKLAGEDCLLITEHGFDATHVFAAIWPSGEDEMGKRPFGAYARWLAPGTVEICRVKDVRGAHRAWENGGVPIVNDSDVTRDLMQLQAQFVNADHSSRTRPDARAPGK